MTIVMKHFNINTGENHMPTTKKPKGGKKGKPFPGKAGAAIQKPAKGGLKI